MSVWPSADDLPACPNCDARKWVAEGKYYYCGSPTPEKGSRDAGNGCGYRTRISSSHQGTLDWPSQPVGQEHINRAALEANVNLDDEDRGMQAA